MKANARGLAVVKLIIALVVLAGIVVGVLYFGSDVWRTRINAAGDQFARWTPENIAKDPENYLNFCEEQTHKNLTDLKANEISIAQSKGKLEGMLDEAATKVRVGEKAVTELKGLYTTAEKSNSWPVMWQGGERSKEQMQQQIVTLHRQVQSQKKLRETVDAGIKKLDVQSDRVRDARAKANEQLAEIKTNREILKVNKISDELTQRLLNMKAALQSTISVASDTSAIVSIDQLTQSASAGVDAQEFEKIMGAAPAKGN